MTTNNVGSNLQAAQDAQDAIRQNKTATASKKKDAVKAALNEDKTSQASQKKETASNSAKPAAKVDISADAKKAAGAEGKTTEKAAATEGKTTEKAKPVNSYDQLMSKIKAREAKGNEAKTTEKAAATEGKTTEKAEAAEGKKEEKAKQVNPYANAHSAQDIRKVTSQLMSKAKAATGDKQRSLRAVV